MEGFEFQLRTRPLAGARQYPLTLDQRIKEGDRFRVTEENLHATLHSIDRYFSSPQAGPHNGNLNCERCSQKRRQVWQAYHDYYLGLDDDRWDSQLTNYRQEMQQMLNSVPGQLTMEDVQNRFEQELREHLKKDLTAPHPELDTMNLAELKRITLLQFDQGKPTSGILTGRLDAEINSPSLQSKDAITFITDLQASKTSQDRVKIYQKYYCTPEWDDSPHQRNAKAKYSRLFERGLSHDTVLDEWKKEALSSQKEEITKLNEGIKEFNYAQKAQKKKEEERNQKMQDQQYVMVPRQMARCSLERCGREIDLTNGNVLECALCDWLTTKDRSENRDHGYYCSKEHLEEDFEDHDHERHSCSMASYCIYDPENGPEETGQGGICPDCMDYGLINYFCSLDCYLSNLELHCEKVHHPKDIQGRTDHLEVFHTVSDPEILAS